MSGSAVHFTDLFDQGDLQAALDARLITIRDDGAGLQIWNYSDTALFTPGAWDNPAVRHCRGLIVDLEGHIKARPWAKFFNHGQPEAGDLDLDAPVEVTDKLDGSLGIVYRGQDGQQRVATRGSFESDQAVHATEILNACYPNLASLDSVTPLVEIIYPGNRIVCDYGDLDDLVLLGGVVISTGEYLSPIHAAIASAWTGPITRVFEYDTLRETLEAPPRPGAEGLCVRYLGEHRILKIKQEDYVRLHRIVTGLSERTVWEHMSEGKSLEDLLAPLPDELHQWTRDVWERLALDVRVIANDAHLAHNEITSSLPAGFERREYAELAKQCGPLAPLLFQLLDGKDPRPSILRTLKPAGDTRAKAISEATA